MTTEQEVAVRLHAESSVHAEQMLAMMGREVLGDDPTIREIVRQALVLSGVHGGRAMLGIVRQAMAEEKGRRKQNAL